MKRTVLAILCLLLISNAGAQTMRIYKNGELKATFEVTDDMEITFSDDEQDEHEYVDLGLPSGVKWATCNLGASEVTDGGGYYAWGETSTKNNYNWGTYKWCAGEYNTLTKYNFEPYYGNNGFWDDKYQLDLSDDAAHVAWGGAWRMPTYKELQELLANCYWEWGNYFYTWMYRGTSKINGACIYLPANGYQNYDSKEYVGQGGFYWTSSMYYDEDGYTYMPPNQAIDMSFDTGNTWRNMDWRLEHRYIGMGIRPVFK